MQLSLTSKSEHSLVEQIVGEIGRRIEGRQLASGQKLPSIRRLAEGNGVSKFTVIEAYDRLVAAGLLSSRRNSGFFVAARQQPLSLAEPEISVARDIDPVWIMRQSLTLDDKLLKPGCGWLPNDWLNEESLRRKLHEIARAPGARLLEYAHPLGHLPLRQQLHLRLAALEIEAPPQRILLTDGASQAIDLVCRFLLQPGDTVLIDDPGYFNFQGVARAHRAKIVGVPLNPSGIDLAAFEALLVQHRPKLYLMNAALQNPTGLTMNAGTAYKLLRLAETHDLRILEDDIFADFQATPGQRLAALDQLDRVIYLGSFSKTLSAAVRCGFIATRADWIEGLTDLKLATSFGNNDLSAQLVSLLLADGSYRKHVEAIRQRLRAAMTQTKRRLAQGGLRLWHEPEEGLFLWSQLPPGYDSAELARHALAEGIVLAPGNVFSVNRTAGQYLRFNVAQSGAQRIFDFLRGAF